MISDQYAVEVRHDDVIVVMRCKGRLAAVAVLGLCALAGALVSLLSSPPNRLVGVVFGICAGVWFAARAITWRAVLRPDVAAAARLALNVKPRRDGLRILGRDESRLLAEACQKFATADLAAERAERGDRVHEVLRQAAETDPR